MKSFAQIDEENIGELLAEIDYLKSKLAAERNKYASHICSNLDPVDIHRKTAKDCVRMANHLDKFRASLKDIMSIVQNEASYIRGKAKDHGKAADRIRYMREQLDNNPVG